MKRSILLAVLLASSCRQPVHERTLELSCRPEVPEKPVIATAVPWTKLEQPVEPKGTYLKRHPADGHGPTAPPPTSLDIARDLRLVPGDYVGLQSYGRWYWGHDTSPTGPTSNSLVAVFADAKGNPLSPAKSGQERPFRTQNMYFSGDSTDIGEDFGVPADKEVIVRIPSGAAKIFFTVDDSAFNDNSAAGSFGVTVFEPNHKFAKPAPAAEGLDASEADHVFSIAELRRLLAGDLPEATNFGYSPFVGSAADDAASQWRGNYPNSGWLPMSSTYAGSRPEGRHWGWDIFSPEGTPLVAPVWPSQVTYGTQLDPKKKTGWGNYAAFAFRYRGRKLILLYAHLSRNEGGARRINGPEVVAYSGCSGLSASDLAGCGKRLTTPKAKDTRVDHVHVSFIDGTALKEGNACDPRAVLNWKID